MKNPVFLLVVFVLAIATAYAISQDATSRQQTPQRPAVGASHGADQRTSPASGADPLEIAPAPQVQSEIQNAIGRQPGLSGKAIQVKVDDDIIELSGTVDNGKDKVTIYRLAESYAINRRVKDLVTVANRRSEQSSAASNPKTSDNSEARSRQSEGSSNITAAQR